MFRKFKVQHTFDSVGLVTITVYYIALIKLFIKALNILNYVKQFEFLIYKTNPSFLLYSVNLLDNWLNKSNNEGKFHACL